MLQRSPETRSGRLGAARLPRSALALLLCLTACASPPAESPEAEAPAPPSLAEANRLLQARDPAGAETVLEALVAAEPENVRAWSLLGRARRQGDDLEGALEAYGSALAVDPSAAGALYGALGIHAVRGETDPAFELLERLREGRKVDLSQLPLDPDLAPLLSDPRFEAFRMSPEDFADPFVEPTRILHEWVGEAAGDEFGWIARNLGDVDGDSVADLVTSAPGKAIGGPAAGKIYVYSGRGGELLWSVEGSAGDRFGEGIENAGDVNRDGVADVIASAPGGDWAGVFSGRDGTRLLRLEASQAGERFGRHPAGVGDVDGDGHDDVLIGAPRNDTAGEDAGRAGLYSGRDGSLLREWLGEEAGDRLGEAVEGERHGEEGYLLIGAPDAGEGDRGRVYVYREALDEEPAFVIEPDELGAELGGMFLSVVGDLDADGVADLYASDFSHGAQGPSTGQIVVHSGADGRRLLTLSGEAAGDGFGIGPADAGDVDGDGHDDLVIGAWQHGSEAPSGGKVYLYSGADGSLLRAWTCRVMGDTFGFDATGLGDIDGDGTLDLLLTSAWSAVHGPKTGRVFVVSSGA